MEKIAQKSSFRNICGLLCAALLAVCALSACGKKKPQLPGNKQTGIDSVALAMLEINQRLVQEANAELTGYVLESGLPYVQDERGFWYLLTRRTQGLPLQKDQSVTIAQRVYLLDGTLCEDLVLTAQIGKKQLLGAVDAALLLLHEGEQATLLVPWYLAYGPHGNQDNIGAYTNVRIEIEIMEL